MASATTKQINYMELLFSELGFLRIHRNDFISVRVQRTVKALDEISSKEASDIITELLEMKNAKSQF